MPNRQLAGSIVALLLCVPLVAQENEELEAIIALCGEVACHPAEPIRINMENGETVEFDMDIQFPIVLNGYVSLHPETSIFLAADLEDGVLQNLQVVDEPDEKINVLHIRMWQEPGEASTYLKVTNYFSEMIKYRAGMMMPEGDSIFSTSSCPVMGDGRAGFEYWPQPIFQLILTNFHVIVADDGTITCE